MHPIGTAYCGRVLATLSLAVVIGVWLPDSFGAEELTSGAFVAEIRVDGISVIAPSEVAGLIHPFDGKTL